MEKLTTQGRVVGLLFLAMILLGTPSTIFRGISTSFLESVDFLEVVFQNSMKMKIGIAMNLFSGMIGMSIALFIYPLIKQNQPHLSRFFLALWITQFGVVIFSNISHLMLITLSQRYTALGATDTYYTTIGEVLGHGYIWAHLTSLLLYSSGALLLFITFIREKLIPGVIAAWGIVAVSIVFFATWAQIFEVEVSFNLYMQNGLHMIIMTLWLLIKGFRDQVDSRVQLASTN